MATDCGMTRTSRCAQHRRTRAKHMNHTNAHTACSLYITLLGSLVCIALPLSGSLDGCYVYKIIIILKVLRVVSFQSPPTRSIIHRLITIYPNINHRLSIDEPTSVVSFTFSCPFNPPLNVPVVYHGAPDAWKWPLPRGG